MRDLQDIIGFVGEKNPGLAHSTFDRIKRRVEALVRFPRRGRVVPELKAIGLDIYRELVVFPYRLLFRIKGKEVLVLGVFDGRRDMEEVLFERLTRP